MTNREKTFSIIKEKLKGWMRYSDDAVAVFNCDSLVALKQIPDHSVSLILTDPPYHTTKKKNIFGDASFASDDEYIAWMELFSNEWRRIIKPNGSIFCFCSSAAEARLEVMFSKNFNILSSIVWTKPNLPGFDGWKQKMKKEALRQWYPQSERAIFMEPAVEGNLNRSTFGDLLRSMRTEVGLSGKDLAELTGAYGKVNHGGSVANWEAGRNVPSRQQYALICKALIQSGYKKEIPSYEDAIRPFIISKNDVFTDVWDYPNIKPYKGKHPAEKPVQLLEAVIRETTFEGDVVLDCFAGSGATGVAALRASRKCVCIDIEETWSQKMVLLFEHVKNSREFPDNYLGPLFRTPQN